MCCTTVHICIKHNYKLVVILIHLYNTTYDIRFKQILPTDINIIWMNGRNMIIFCIIKHFKTYISK